MSSYKHLLMAHAEMLNRLCRKSDVNLELAKGILGFARCLVKPGLESIDLQIFSVVMSTYMGISDQSSITKVYNGLVKDAYGLTVEQFADILCLFYSDSLDMKIDYVYSLFNKKDQGIGVSELSAFIRTCVCVTDTDDAEKDETFSDLCAIVFDCFNITTSGVITLDNFRSKVKKNTLILAMLGQNIPSKHMLDSFRHKIVGKTNAQLKETFGNMRTNLLFEPPDISKPKYYPIDLDLP